MDLLQEITAEKEAALEKYGHFNSTHEAYAVLQEEVDELWEIVKRNTERHYGLPKYKAIAMKEELIQIAAVAIRIAEELETEKIKHV